MEELQNKINNKSLEEKGVSWQNQNHSVLIIGWGVQKQTGTRYWIIRNSYGPRWGVLGDFLIRRGGNDFGIEADMISFDPVLCDQAVKDHCQPI
jgi:cathepsin C